MHKNALFLIKKLQKSHRPPCLRRQTPQTPHENSWLRHCYEWNTDRK